MKKIFLTLAIIFSSTPVMAIEYPTGFFFKPYMGADYDYMHVSYKDGGGDVLKSNLNGFDIHAGARVNKYLGFEGSYLWTANADKDNVLGSGIDTSVNVRGFTLDALGYLPVTSDNKLELIGTVGVSRLKAEFSATGIVGVSGSETEYKPRFGAGAEYWVTDNSNLRGLVRYQAADFDDNASHAIVASVGLNYQF